MTRRVLSVYLDSSVIFAAVLSPDGGSRKLFQLSAARVVRIVLGAHVLKEAEEVVRRKMPASLPELARLLSVSRVDVESTAGMEHLEEARKLVSYRPDARVLAEAMSLGVDWFVTHDKEHFLRANLKKRMPFEIGTPGDLLQSIKAQLTGG
jgi:predicted nucleic acid-binding protein